MSNAQVNKRGHCTFEGKQLQEIFAPPELLVTPIARKSSKYDSSGFRVANRGGAECAEKNKLLRSKLLGIRLIEIAHSFVTSACL
jgi:hypothetical protein